MRYMERKRTALPKFHARTPDDRLDTVTKMAGLESKDRDVLRAGLHVNMADSLIENMIGVFTLPLGVATNFRINGRDLLIPMVTEEPSVIAAASSGAKATKDIIAQGSPSHVTGQIQIMNPDSNASEMVNAQKNEIINRARDSLSSHMSVCEMSSVFLDKDMMKIDIIVDTGEAMGANAINTMCERVSPLIEKITGGRALLRILSNHLPRVSHAEAFFDVDSRVARDIIDSYRFAALDKSRAVTHNKGIMNGIAAVGMATGQDVRALEAGAHASGAKADTVYGPLSRWEIRDGKLWGELSVPLIVGTVGGLTKNHPAAVTCLKMLGNPTAGELSGIMAAVGLCQNFAALRALVTDGIQKGHMKLHKRRQDGSRAADVSTQTVSTK